MRATLNLATTHTGQPGQVSKSRPLRRHTTYHPTMGTSDLYRAIEKRMLHDVAQSLSVGNKARRIRARLFDEAKNLPPDDVDDALLTPVQKRFRETIHEATQGLEGLFAAFGRELAVDNIEDDPASAAAAQMVGSMMGSIVALELRVAALEAALD